MTPSLSPSHPCRLLTDGWLTDRRVEPTANRGGLHCTIATANHWTPHWARKGSQMSLLYHNIIIITIIIIIIILSRCFSAAAVIRIHQIHFICKHFFWTTSWTLNAPPNSQSSPSCPRPLFGSPSRRLRSTAHTGSCVLVQDGIVHSGAASGASGVGSRGFTGRRFKHNTMGSLWCHRLMSQKSCGLIKRSKRDPSRFLNPVFLMVSFSFFWNEFMGNLPEPHRHKYHFKKEKSPDSPGTQTWTLIEPK